MMRETRTSYYEEPADVSFVEDYMKLAYAVLGVIAGLCGIGIVACAMVIFGI